MASIALYYPPGGGPPILVYSKNCTADDRKLDFACPSCLAPLKLRGGKKIKLHFFGTHNPNCDIAKFQLETLIVKNGVAVHLEAICHHPDRPYNPEGSRPGPASGTGPQPGPEPGPEPKEIEKKNIVYTAKVLTSAKALKNNIWHLPLHFPLSLDGALKVGDVIVRHDNLASCRKKGIDGEIRFLLAHRIPLEKVPPAIRKEGYIYFRDALSSSDDEAFYLLVCMAEPTQHEHLLNLVAGPLGVRDPHKYIALLGQWERLPNCPYNAYCAAINSDCYFFTNVK